MEESIVKQRSRFEQKCPRLREIAGDGDEDHADEDDAAADCGS